MSERDIFIQALQQADVAERKAYLDEACGGDTALRERIEGLFKVYDNAGSFLESPTAAAAATIDQPEITEWPGTVIGPYKLLQQIGEGGMGTVFMAEQSQPVQRKVALKVIKPGMDSRQVIARFEAERQALAMMDHVNIARVLDAGTVEFVVPPLGGSSEPADRLKAGLQTGRPYFVMELVHGVPITKYCDDNRLTPRQRLELFVPVCQAIQHAHQKGIIHRDIKPSNVLITLYDGRPVPKVIDFGLAKATEQRLIERTLSTQYGTLVGTLEYMSPEQAERSALGVDTRSDIYSLGVLLYELLTGSTPLSHERLQEAAYAEILRLIKEEEPPKPSSRLSDAGEALASISAQRNMEPAKLTKLVRGELDWIVMKTLEKDRNRRYETANAFAADVQRYLADEPVQACPPSAGYRFRKFVRRNKGPVLAASLVVLALVGGVIGTTIGLYRAKEARQAVLKQWQRAEANAEKALDAAEAEKKSNETAQAREAETLAVLDFMENKVFAAARPEGEEGGLGRDVPLRKAVEAALPFVATKFADQPLIEARLRLTLGQSFDLLGDTEIAAEQFEAARALYTQHRGPDDPDTLRSMNFLAKSYFLLARHAEALNLREETLMLRKAKLGPDHPDTLTSMSDLAASIGAYGRLAEALQLREKTLALRKDKLGPDHPDTLWSMNELANSYYGLGRHAQSLELKEATLAIQQAKLGPDDNKTLGCMYSLAHSYDIADRHADALQLREKLLTLTKAKFGPDHSNTLLSMYSLALSYDHHDRRAEALELHEETLALRKAQLGPDHGDTLASMWGVAKGLVKLDRSTEAVPIIDECLQRAEGKIVDGLVIPLVMDLRLRHFEKIRDAAGCLETARMWEVLKRADAGSLYNSACNRAVSAAVIQDTDKTPTGEVKAKEQADQAMAWLKQAVAAGYKDVAHIKKDTDLDALRDREDFNKLLAELQGSP